jgi:hypothetical protein
MVRFHAEGKVKLIVPMTNLESCMLEKCLCVMFNFHLETMHVSKDDIACDDNNNVIRSIYQV